MASEPFIISIDPFKVWFLCDPNVPIWPHLPTLALGIKFPIHDFWRAHSNHSSPQRGLKKGVLWVPMGQWLGFLSQLGNTDKVM